MAYKELIKKFENIREYMREFFVYGFKNREEIGRKSARSYDNERRRIESWLGESMSFSRSANGKAKFISIDTRKVSKNPLYNAFKAKSFTSNDIVLHFLLLDILDEAEWKSFSEIVEGFYQEYADRLENEPEIEPPVIRLKLNEYVKEGIIECRKNGKNSCYRRSADKISVKDWKEAVAFYSEAGPLGVIGSYMLDNPALKDMAGYSSKYRFKHHYLVHVLESQILYRIFEAMNSNSDIQVTTIGRSSKNKTDFEIYPVKVYESTQNGRMYILGYEMKYKNFRFFRMDNIVEVKMLGIREKPELIYQKYEELLPYLWGVSLNNNKRNEHVEMTLVIKKKDSHILTRLQREKRNGRIEELGNDRYRYEADVSDSMELMPWIRSFIGRIENLECTNKNFERIFYEDLEEMNRLYFGGDESDF